MNEEESFSMQQLSPMGSQVIQQYQPHTVNMQQQSPTDPYRPIPDSYSSESNLDADMYLEPSSNNNNSYMRSKPLQRNPHEHDSGVIPDVDHIQPDLNSLNRTPRNSNTSGTPRNSNTSVHSPGLPVPPYSRQNQALPHPSMGSKRPESLAVRGHEYEELPGHKYLTSNYTYPESEGYKGQPTPTKSVKFGGSKENLCHSGSNGSMLSDRPAPPVYRKRHNPLYEEEKDAMVPKKSKAQSGICQCPCIAILIFNVLSLVSFILVLLLMTGVVETTNSNSDYPRTGALSSDNNYSVEYVDLEQKYQDLLEKVNRLETESRQNKNTMDSQVVDLERKVAQLNTQIETVSKMQGPPGVNGSQGPPGAGDLSKCIHIVRTGISAAVSRATTPWFPQAPDERERVIMGLYCSHEYEGAAGTYLETDDNQSPTRYRCLCAPIVQPTTTSHECKLHVWHCPRDS